MVRSGVVLGYVNDNPDHLKKLMVYLENANRHKKEVHANMVDPVITAQQVDAAIQAFSARLPKPDDVRHDVVYRAMLDALTAAARVKDDAAHSQ